MRAPQKKQGEKFAVLKESTTFVPAKSVQEVIDYVVVHELCHRKEMNHSKSFWSEVEKVLPNYRKSLGWLKEEGSQIMRRLYY